jgi:uncharacterized membrane protein HdeD (DUF308 family)
MSIEVVAEKPGLHQVGAEVLGRSWGWYLALGIVLVVIGTFALGSAMLFTLTSVVLFGWLLIAAGLLEAFHAFWRKKWGGFFVDLLTGILYVVVGFMIVANPAASAVSLTLLIALFLIFSGISRIVIALTVQVHNRAWLALHGVIVLLLGISIWNNWPLSGLWVIGLFVGIELILNGWSLIMLSLAAKRLSRTPATEAAVA